MKVMFKEFGKEMSIENLSSGEKQVVFRGGFLLKDRNSSHGAIVMIDEPEISMHPTWQLNILEFFRKFFELGDGMLSCQNHLCDAFSICDS